MTIDLRLSFDIATGAFEEAMKAQGKTIARAATGAMDAAVVVVKTKGRANIAAAGFSKRWQNALRVTRYPNQRGAISYEPSAWVFDKIEYAGIFEDGGKISGDPLLWLPLSGTPQRISGNIVRPSKLASAIGQRLVSFTSRSGTPLLGAKMRVTKAQKDKPNLKVSLTALKRGSTGKKAEGGSLFRTIPLFYGIKQVTIPKKLSIREVCAAARDQIPSLYAAALANALKE